MRSCQVLGLQDIGIPALALTSLTSKEDQNAAYKRLDSDLDIRLVYGDPQLSCTRSLFCILIARSARDRCALWILVNASTVVE